MKKILFLSSILFALSCKKENIIIPSSDYDCNLAISDNSENHPKKEKFENAMQKVIAYTPGIQIAVRSKDGNLWLGTQGYADIPNNIPFENCTKTIIGSISKIHTAVLIMQLHEAGILSIDDPIKKWLPTEMVSKIANADLVSIKQLLNHMSGIAEYLGIKHHINSVNIENHKLTPQEKIKLIYNKSARFSPGEKYDYSNSNYVLLGLIIEKARNMSLDEAERIYITNPLGLVNTLVGTSEEPIPVGTARPYQATKNNEKYYDVMQFAVSDAATGDGGVATNMQESLLFIEALFNGELVSNETLELMKNERVVEPGNSLLSKQNWYGLGLEQSQNKYGLTFGHSGSTSSYWSFLIHYPESNVTVSIAFNGSSESGKHNESLYLLILELIDLAFE